MGGFRGVLQAGSGLDGGAHYLPAEADAVHWGRLPARDDAPVLTIDPGTEVVIDTVSHEGILEDQGRDPAAFFGANGVAREHVLDEAVALAASDHPRDPAKDGPHVVTGPIHVRGARPGDLLRLTVVDVTPRVPYGVISNRHGARRAAGRVPARRGQRERLHAHRAARRRLVRLAAGQRRRRARRAVPARAVPRHHGRRGRRRRASALGAAGCARRQHRHQPAHRGGFALLPVQVPGALAYVGDPHFAQGGGEVALTALEASLRATIRFEVVPAETAVRDFGELAGPLAETSEYLVPTGLDADLDLAMQDCVRQAIGLLGARFGMEPHLASAYLSAATDFDISQVVDLVKGVHARIRTSDFRAVRRGGGAA